MATWRNDAPVTHRKAPRGNVWWFRAVLWGCIVAMLLAWLVVAAWGVRDDHWRSVAANGCGVPHLSVWR